MDKKWTLAIVAAAAVVGVLAIVNLGDPETPQASIGLDPVLGQGNLTVFLFEDYQCSHCRDYALSPEYADFLATWVETDQVKLVFKHVAFVGPYSEPAAVASRCVFQAASGAWSDWDHAVYADPPTSSQAGAIAAHLRLLAEEADVDMPAYDDCMAAPEAARQTVAQNREELVALARGTPTLLVDGTTFNPHAEARQVDDAIRSALGDG